MRAQQIPLACQQSCYCQATPLLVWLYPRTWHPVPDSEAEALAMKIMVMQNIGRQSYNKLPVSNVRSLVLAVYGWSSVNEMQSLAKVYQIALVR